MSFDEKVVDKMAQDVMWVGGVRRVAGYYAVVRVAIAVQGKFLIPLKPLPNC